MILEVVTGRFDGLEVSIESRLEHRLRDAGLEIVRVPGRDHRRRLLWPSLEQALPGDAGALNRGADPVEVAEYLETLVGQRPPRRTGRDLL